MTTNFNRLLDYIQWERDGEGMLATDLISVDDGKNRPHSWAIATILTGEFSGFFRLYKVVGGRDIVYADHVAALGDAQLLAAMHDFITDGERLTVLRQVHSESN